MRNYFNAEERTRHIITLAMQETIAEFKNSTALTAEEKRYLNTALTNIQKFNVSVYERFGKSYMRKVENTMRDNDLRLIGKGAKYTECISHAAEEDLLPTINDLRMLNCLDCEKCDYKNCAIYAICTACDINVEENLTKEKGGCPFGI